MAKCMLTTVDNPFDPFDQFKSWLMYDMDKSYGTCSYLDQMSDEENDSEIERAIDEIIKYDFQNIYKKVKRSA